MHIGEPVASTPVRDDLVLIPKSEGLALTGMIVVLREPVLLQILCVRRDCVFVWEESPEFRDGSLEVFRRAILAVQLGTRSTASCVCDTAGLSC